jgi:hypothetical protein
MRVDHTGQLVDSSSTYVESNMVNDSPKTRNSRTMHTDKKTKSDANDRTKVVPPLSPRPSKQSVPASNRSPKTRNSKTIPLSPRSSKQTVPASNRSPKTRNSKAMHPDYMVKDSPKTRNSRTMHTDKKKKSDANDWTKVVPPLSPRPSKQTVPASDKSITKKTDTKNSKPTSDRSITKKKSKDKSASDRRSTFKEDAKNLSSTRSIKVGHRTVQIEQPPKSLILIWALVSAELALDLVTTGIAFSAFLSTPEPCCGLPISDGVLPLATTIPFFFLVIAELIFLLRAIMLTLFPKYMMNQVEVVDPEDRQKNCCGCKWTPHFFVWLVNFLTVINPFFGLAIAYLLMYQSDKTEALTVMGLEGATIILHFLAVYLEKAATTRKLQLMHSLIILPFLATVGLNVWYITRGGVCYDAFLETFWYKGCEVCPGPDKSWPVNGTLCLVDGSNETYKSYDFWDLDSATNCDPDVLVCWFPF